MKRIKIGISFILIVIIIFMAVGCNGTEKLPNPIDPEQNTSDKIFYDGKSDYKILIPQKANEDEIFASEELQQLLRQSTNFQMPIISDTAMKSGDKYLSIGKTELMKNSSIVIDFNELKTSGHKVLTENNNVIMSGAKGEGTVYAVYSFLEKIIGLKIYAYDEIKVIKKTEIYLPILNLTILPSIERRSLGENKMWIGDKKQKTRRMKIVLPEEGYSIFGHTVINITLPKELYVKDHREWYTNPDSTDPIHCGQLCLSNVEMRAEFIKRSKEIILSKPDCDYYMIGMEDNYEYCTCDKCNAMAKANGGFRSGNFIEFSNAVGSALDAWMKELDPNRKMYYVIYAYFHNEAAPVKLDSHQKYIPVNEKVIPNDNIVVMYAPLNADFTYSINDDRNTVMKNTIEQWLAVTNNIYMYSYSYNYPNFFMPTDIFSCVGGSYQMAGSNDFFGYYEEGGQAVSMEGLRNYVMSQMMWDSNQNLDELAFDFIDNFYGPAANTHKKYYSSLRQWMTYCSENLGSKRLIMSGENYAEKFWPKYLLQKWDSMFDTMFSELATIQNTLPDDYAKYYDRVKQDQLSVRFMLCDFYGSSYDKTTLNEMIDDLESNCNRLGILLASGSGSVSDKIAGWRN